MASGLKSHVRVYALTTGRHRPPGLAAGTMSIPDLSDQLGREWRAALEHARYGDEHVCLIIVDAERVKNANMAEHHPPGLEVMSTALLTGEWRTRANSRGCREQHRIAIWKPDDDTSISNALFAAKVRHELEHVRQWDEAGKLAFDLSGPPDNVLWEVYRDQPGGSQYYNEKPIEADANAASGAFLRSRFPEDIQAAVFEHDDGRGYGHHAEDSPGDPKTLVVRTLEFIKSYPEEARQRASIGIPFGRFLELMHGPEAAAIWAELQA